MATKIRLQRHGHKDYAFYPIVIADSRAPRDGRFIERIGSYNPNTNPATISLNFERALYWINVGAIPTDTVRNILSREGVMLMKHLQGGVKKGAFTEEEAQKRFEAWKAEKQAKLDAVRNKDRDDKKAATKKAIAEEAKKNEAKAKVMYDFLDSSKLFHGTVEKKDRSLMNVPFITGDKDKDAAVVAATKAAGFDNLKGHKSVGGLRASVYNAMPIEGVEALVEFLKKYEAENA